MARERPGWLLLLALAFLGGTAALFFADAPREAAPPYRNPLAVVAGDRPNLPVEVFADPAEPRHPVEVLVRVLRRTDEAPVGGARVLLRDSLTTWTRLADGEGEVAFSGVEAGACSLLARAEGFAEARTEAVLKEGGGNEVVLQVGEAPLVEGRVVAAAGGKPVAGATIHATPNPGTEVRTIDPPSAVTDEAGTFRLRAGSTGQALTLVVAAKGFVPARRYLPLPATDAVATIEIALDATGILRGTVRDPAGRPCPTARVFAYPAGTEIRPAIVGTGPALTASAGADGAYAVEGLAVGGLYLVGAAAPGFGRSEEREVFLEPGGPEARADFVLRARAGVFVKWPSGTRNNEAMGSVTLRDAANGGVTHATSGQGSARFEDVAPGRYEVEVAALNAYRKGRASVEVKAGETAIVEIALTDPIEGDALHESVIEGLVTDGSGVPVAGVRVSAAAVVPEGVEPRLFTRAGSIQVPGRGFVRYTSTARTGQDGRFRIEGLKEGADYRLLATTQGRYAGPEASVRAPAAGVEVVLSALGHLRGRLVPPAGAERVWKGEILVGGIDLADRFRSVATVGAMGEPFDSGELVPGPCRITAVAGEYLLPPRAAEVRAGETVDLGDLPLVRGVMLAGRVMDSAGKPFPEVQVAVIGPVDAHDRTGEDGRFALGPVAEGEAALSLALPGEVPLLKTVAAARGGEVGDLVLPRNGILRILATRAGRPFAGAAEILAAGGRLYAVARTDHLGRCSFPLPAREYQVVIRDPADRNRVLAEAPASVREGEEAEVRLTIPR